MNGLCSFRSCLKVQTVTRGSSGIPEQGIHRPIDEQRIHVWSARYSDLEPDFAFLSSLVSRDEILKAAGYKRSCDSRQYILRHGMVRAVLGYYLGRDPEEIRFVHGMNGKPELDPKGSFLDIRFSLSRTDEMVCLGISWKSEIGLDIAKTQIRSPVSEIERYLFSPGEKQWIAQTVPGQRSIRFIRIWALKEALLKVTGGNARMMQEVDVSGILTDSFLNGCYAVPVEKRVVKYFIHEGGCGAGHHRVIAQTIKNPDTS